MSDFRKKLAPLLSQVCGKLGVTQLLDYHCGNDPIMAYLSVGHKMKIQCYDPNIERFKPAALAAELVFFSPESEPDLSSIQDVELLTGVVAIFAIQTEDPEKWVSPLIDVFEMQTFQRIDGGFYAILYCKPNIHIETAHAIKHDIGPSVGSNILV